MESFYKAALSIGAGSGVTSMLSIDSHLSFNKDELTCQSGGSELSSLSGALQTPC